MGTRLLPCTSCARHIRVGSASCHFCAAALPADFGRESELAPPPPGLSRFDTYQYVARRTASTMAISSAMAAAALATLTCVAAYGSPCAGLDMSTYSGPSCPNGSPVCGPPLVGFSDTCSACLEGKKGCPTFSEQEPCTVADCDSAYYSCFCTCGAGDKTCWAGCLASASASCQSCIHSIQQCATTTCKSSCSGG
jgi:hypothetical protein